MKTYMIDGIITAQTSISHIGFTHGINAKLRREIIVQPNGEIENVPIISGNAIRGILRDVGMLHMVRNIGYKTDDDFDAAVVKAGARSADIEGEQQEIHLEEKEKKSIERSGLSLAAFYFLFSGGALTKDAGRGLDIDAARKWRKLIPLVALFGGAMGNQIMPGMIKIGKMIPICSETAHLIPEKYIDGFAINSCWEFCQEEAFTRRDDEKNEKLRQLISGDVRKQIEEKAASQRQATQDNVANDVVEETGQKQQMRHFVETIAAGTRLYWEVILDDVTDIQLEAFLITLAEFSRMPFIGGRSGTGHGKISMRMNNWIEIDSRLAPQGKELAFTIGTLYTNHLEKNRDEIRGLLDELV